MRLLDRFRQFMIGRYGSDQLNMALVVGYVLLSIVFSFTGWDILLFASYVLAFLVFFRMFSKDTTKRWKENQQFLKYYTPIINRIKSGTSSKVNTDKNHKIFVCGKCGQKIRVPKGKGKIVITCPKCKQEFVKRT